MNYADTNWLEADFDGRLYVDPMSWSPLRRDCEALFDRYAWKLSIGTLDVAIVASAKLAAATCFLSFDTVAKALAAAEGLAVFPPLDAAGNQVLSRLKC